ncbi:MAG: Uma2 family endonuclease [Fimbriiglobus sp.]
MSTDLIKDPRTLDSLDPYRIGYRYVPTGKLDAKGHPVLEKVPLTEEDYVHPQEGDRFLLTDAHTINYLILRNAMDVLVKNLPNAKVFSEHRIDWEYEGIEPHGPDLVVMEDCPADWDPYRGTFMVGEAGATPLAVFEITSPATRHKDFETKYLEYQEVGIPYYIIIDVAGPEGGQRILGFRHDGRSFRTMRLDERMGYMIPNLRLWIRWDNDRVMISDEDGTDIPDNTEVHELLREARAELETKTQLLTDTQASLKAERQKAETERQKAEAEKLRADAETKRADDLARELAELKARLDGNH